VTGIRAKETYRLLVRTVAAQLSNRPIVESNMYKNSHVFTTGRNRHCHGHRLQASLSNGSRTLVAGQASEELAGRGTNGPPYVERTAETATHVQ